MTKHQKTIWTGIEDLNGSSSALPKEEFFELPVLNTLSDESEMEESSKGSSRRDFLKYMGFGLGAAVVAAGCETPIRKAIPYITKPDSIVPGVATYYASSFVNGGDYCSILVKTREGRPIKIEGNGLSNVTKGGTSARAQASVLDLYDTARFRGPSMSKDGSFVDTDWASIDKELGGLLTPNSKVRILSHTVLSPSTKLAIEAFKAKYPNTDLVQYDPISSTALLLANEQKHGKKAIANYHFDKANTIVTLGADFLGTWVSPVEYAHDYAKGRKVRGVNAQMSRLIAIESYMSLTGSNADHRIVIRPSEAGLATVALYNALASVAGASSVSMSGSFKNPKADAAIKAAAKDLWENRGKNGKGSLVVSASNNIAEQMLVNEMNEMLGGKGITFDFDNYSLQRQGDDLKLRSCFKEMENGQVDAAFILGDANPLYDLPDSKRAAAALAKVPVRAAFAVVPNETTEACNYILPIHHQLESWGDAQPKAKEYSLIQPTIVPLFDTRQFETSLLMWSDDNSVKTAGEDDVYYTFMKSSWEKNAFGSQSTFSTFRSFWDKTLHDGVVTLSGATVQEVKPAAPASNEEAPAAVNMSSAASKVTKPLQGTEIAFFETVNLGSGVYANNPWLQEMPDPITRCVWANTAHIAIEWEGVNSFAGFKGLTSGDKVEITVGDHSIKIPVTTVFGQQTDATAIALGYGRSEGGASARNSGENAYPMLGIDSDGLTQYFAVGTMSDKVGSDKTYACVQHHHTLGVTGIDEETNTEINVDEKALGYKGFQGSLTKRSILRHSELSELPKKVANLKKERKHHQKLNSYTLYPDYSGVYGQGHHWGMNIDLTACTGCGSCQVACVAENNVPVVGKKEVFRHHEMTWLRIDRYFYGDVENPQVVYQPMMCQHCDNAPCENVCPVAATNHSSEGLNQMTYNRCIGTRYCANNCPYKVRRFNWYDYTTADLWPANEDGSVPTDGYPFYADNLTRMVLNPDVTVRSRGVIEKCSFCVQRLQEAKLTAKIEKRQLRDGDVKTACQAACPSDAISFGDMNDGESELMKRNDLPTNYLVLEEVNVRPSVGYLMKVSNKNKDIDA